MIDYKGFEGRRDEAAKRGKYRGIGLSSYIEACGIARLLLLVHWVAVSGFMRPPRFALTRQGR